jgi:hypothetical protein
MTNIEIVLRAAHAHVKMFGNRVCCVDADSRRKNKHTLNLLQDKART